MMSLLKMQIQLHVPFPQSIRLPSLNELREHILKCQIEIPSRSITTRTEAAQNGQSRGKNIKHRQKETGLSF